MFSYRYRGRTGGRQFDVSPVLTARCQLLAAFVLLLLLAALPAQAQQSTASWTGEFFDNPYLVGDVKMTVRNTIIAYNWGTSAPGENIPASYFSARFAADVNFSPGTYRFYLLARDRAALSVDFQTYINTIDAEEGKPEEILTADVTLRGGVTHIQLDFQKLGGAAWLYLDWEPLSRTMRGPAFRVPNSNPEDDIPGEPVEVNNASWEASYFTNRNLEGTPLFTQTESIPTHNWDTGAPITDMSPDNFSVRWKSRQFFDGTPHRFTVEADDGVRVYVNGVLYVDEWHDAGGKKYYSPVFTLAAGYHDLTVEFYEANGTAFIDYVLNRFINIPEPPITTGTAVVTAGRLNVRNLPTAQGSEILTKINRDEIYPVIGRNSNDSWWLIDVYGLKGWVSGAYVTVSNVQNVPIVDPYNNNVVIGTPIPAPTSTPSLIVFTTTATADAIIYTSANTSSIPLGNILRGQSADLLARNSAGSWLKIRRNNVVGWVSAQFMSLPANIRYNDIPVE